eukprot:9330857-Ditylum_brightwellii.AAC.1
MDDSPLKTITVELAQETTQKLALYKFSDIKTFLMMQKSHKYFLSQQEARKKHDQHDQTNDTVLAQLDAIPKDACNKKELAGIKKLQDMAFNLYQQMLSSTLCAEWDNIVQKHCYTAGWLDKNSVASKEN